MSRFFNKQPKQPLPESPRRTLDADPPQDPVSREPGYVKWESNFNYFSGVGSALSALVETWHRRRSRRS